MTLVAYGAGVAKRLSTTFSAPPPRSDGAVLAVLGLALRLVAVWWGSGRFPPAEDGAFYHVVAQRIASGDGYTWLWPDGAVTYAAHYPVGYPALVGALYALFGPRPVTAMLMNAILGALAVYAVHRACQGFCSRAGALLAGFGVALHPTLVFYTPALMTEAVACALVAVAVWLTVSIRAQGRETWGLIVLGLVVGATTLLRPQLLLIAPVFGWVALHDAALRPGMRRLRRALAGAGVVTLLALLVCAPWTLRNCVRMDRCVFVSANGGWNLLIGAGPGATGSWMPVENMMPAQCRSVFGEADKDACFGEAATRVIRQEPVRWLSLVPTKLSNTFDYVGAAAWYLHSSNERGLSEWGKLRMGIAETAWQRLLVLLALVGVARLPGPRRRLRWLLASAGGVCLLSPPAWIAYLALVAAVMLFGRRLWLQPPLVLSAWVIATTALTHAVFFGAGRYGVVCFAVVALLAGGCLPATQPQKSLSLPAF